MTSSEPLYIDIFQSFIFYITNSCYKGLKFNQTSFRAFRHVLSCHGKTKMRPFVARLFNFGNLKSFFCCLAAHDYDISQKGLLHDWLLASTPFHSDTQHTHILFACRTIFVLTLELV